MNSRYSMTLWIAFADFFSALAMIMFALIIVSRAREIDYIPIDEEVKKLAQALRTELANRGLQVPPVTDDNAILLPEVLLFKSGQFDIQSPDNVRGVAEALLAVRGRWRPNFVLVIQGHTDARPPRPNERYKDNLELSRLRAKEVEQYLTKAGVAPPAFQIVSQGVGAAQPKVQNCRSDASHIDCRKEDFRTSDELAANRRIELRFGVFSGNR